MRAEQGFFLKSRAQRGNPIGARNLIVGSATDLETMIIHWRIGNENQRCIEGNRDPSLRSGLRKT
jgi:hypothetical protein